MVESENNQNKEIITILKNIDQKLSILISINKLSSKPPKITEEEKTILKLCNGKHSIQDIVKLTKKTENNVKVVLTHLRKKGIIRSTKIKSKLGYVKI